jgi:hypothetical protein
VKVYKSLKYRIIGVSPLLFHNGQLADPLNRHAKAIAQLSSKRKKTEADHEKMADLEFIGSLYLSGGMPCIPAEMMEAALVRAATQEKRSAKAKAGLVIRQDLILQYEGSKDPAALCADPNFRLRCGVRIGTSRVMRTRPKFSNWAADFTVEFVPTLLNEEDVHSFIATAGAQIGIGDWRPRFGRFSINESAPNDAKTRKR